MKKLAYGNILKGEFKPLDRTALTAPELALLAKLELKNTVLIGCGLDYAHRKSTLQKYAESLRIPALPRLHHAPTRRELTDTPAWALTA